MVIFLSNTLSILLPLNLVKNNSESNLGGIGYSRRSNQQPYCPDTLLQAV